MASVNHAIGLRCSRETNNYEFERVSRRGDSEDVRNAAAEAISGEDREERQCKLEIALRAGHSNNDEGKGIFF